MSTTKILAVKAAFFIGVLAFGSAVAIDTASAADRPLKAPALPGVYHWTGFYGGVNVGSVIGQADAGSAVAANGVIAGADVNSVGAVGGVQAGFNWQFNPSWLVGVEGDFGISASSARTPTGSTASRLAKEPVGTPLCVRARVT